MRIFTTQVGEYANWVGAHYWSASQNAEIQLSDAAGDEALYNESLHGERIPRLFLMDSVDSLGPILPSDTSTEHIEGFRVETITQEAGGLTSASNNPPKYWTDVWALGQLPEHRFILPLSQTPSESAYKFWFEYDRFSQEQVDETQMRKLVEETDSSVDQIRMIIDTRTGMSGFSTCFAEYLGSCYPKASNLTLTSPLPDIQHLSHDHSVPSVVNLLNFIVNEKRRTEQLSASLIVVPPYRNQDCLTTSAQEAVWLDSIPFSTVQNHCFKIESPYLNINGHVVFSPLAPGEHGTFSHSPRVGKFIKNSLNPLEINSQSEILAGTFEEKASLPFLKGSVVVIKRFTRDFQAAWESHSNVIERDDLIEAADTLQGIVNLLLEDQLLEE